MSPLSGKMPIILRRIFSASLGCSQLVQHSDVPDHVVTLYELDSGKPGAPAAGSTSLRFRDRSSPAVASPRLNER